MLQITLPSKRLTRTKQRKNSVTTLLAFHPQPQIASDLGRNVTRNFNPHRNRSQFPSGNEIFGLWPQIQIAAGLNPLRFENRKPNPPLFTGDLNSSNRKPAGRNRRIRAARRPQIAESPATRPLRSQRKQYQENNTEKNSVRRTLKRPSRTRTRQARRKRKRTRRRIIRRKGRS